MNNEYQGHWISTHLVPRFYFLEPRGEDILIEDIAHALSMLCRFGGHGGFFYSVAEHSVVMSNVLEGEGASSLTVLAGLLHDAEEAYLPDIPRPIKLLMPEALEMYKTLNSAIMRKFRLEGADWGLIKEIDHRLCTTEAKALGVWNKDWEDTGKPLEVVVAGWPSKLAKRAFLARYYENPWSLLRGAF